jgi:hypothetical protein
MDNVLTMAVIGDTESSGAKPQGEQRRDTTDKIVCDDGQWFLEKPEVGLLHTASQEMLKK